MQCAYITRTPGRYSPEGTMADRKSVLGPTPHHPELERLLEEALRTEVTEDMLREQRVSFAFGNAPADADGITKESVRDASHGIRIVR